MKNIFHVFRSDIKRISRNVVAIVVVMGLCIIPCLYAWFNILSNWDPYGSASTANLHIAVFSEDAGASYGDLSITVGEKVTDALKANKEVGWEFPESEEETMDGVYSGAYYAAIIIPEDFTENLLSFLSGDPKNPTIQYVENSKKNAIATKITGKVKTAVQREINTTFVETIAQYAAEAGETLLGEDGIGTGMLEVLTEELRVADSKLTTAISLLDAISLLNDSAAELISAADAVIPTIGNAVESGERSVEIIKSGTDAGADTAYGIIDMTDAALSAVISSLDTISVQAQLITSAVDVSTITDLFNEILESRTFEKIGEFMDAAGDTVLSVIPAYNDALEAYNRLVDNMETVINTADTLQADANDIRNSLLGDIERCRSGVVSAQNDLDDVVAPKIIGALDEISGSLDEAAEVLGKTDDVTPALTDALGSYRGTLEEGTAAMAVTKGLAVDLKNDLETLMDRLDGLKATDSYAQLMEILDQGSVTLSSIISSPVKLNETVFYEIKTYGSAMAAFYTILGIWAGALIMTALVKVKVVDHEDNKNITFVQKFFGRYLLFFAIGEIQALLTCLGDLFFIGIECAHPVLFVLTGLISNFVFTMLMYSLTVAFRQVGQAIVVVILVIQVAGAGGTFPVEVLPAPYRVVYRFLPFNYAINAMRECIGGIYGNAYLEYIGKLLIFAAAALVICLLMRPVFAKLMDFIDRNKDESGVML